MKASRAGLARAVDQPDRAIRFYLFHGPDEAQSRGLAERLLKSLSAARFLVQGSAIKADPALLADEAGAMSLFGGARLIWVEPAGDEIAPGVEALLAVPAPESPVVAISGTLKKTSSLLKIAEAHAAALSHASYTPEGQDAERMAVELARTVGLRIERDVAARLCHACGNDRALVLQELTKFALYLDASPETPKLLERDAVEAVGADVPEGEFLKLADLALRGEIGSLAAELGRLPAGGNEAIPVVRSLQRRLQMLAPLRARVDGGERVDDVMTALGKALFWKDKPLVQDMLTRWNSEALATAAERVGRLERDLIFSPAPAGETLSEELIAIARVARRR